ncbi:MAG: hypothetical protein ABFC88_12330 [Thermoguttaceae bacterium]
MPTAIRPSIDIRVNALIREAAQLLVNATACRPGLPPEHGLCRALAALAEVDQETATIPWPPLFEPCP